MERINVFHVIGGLNRGGAETMLMNIFRNIDKEKYKFFFLVYAENEKNYDYKKEVIELGGEIIYLKNRNPLKVIAFLYHFFKHNNIQVVHAHTLFNSYESLIAAKLANIKIRITHSHSTGQVRNKEYIMRAYMMFSKFVIRLFSTHYVGCGLKAGEYLFGEKQFHKNGIIIKNSIDLEKFSPNYVLNSTELKIGCIGSFYRVKNHEFIVKLVKWIIDENKYCPTFYFVGKGYLEASIKEMVRELSLNDKIKFLGTREDIHYLMNEFDILIMPSLYEGVPVTLIEAQACGLPCIISNNISNEVDLGLNLIKFIDLNESFDKWYNAIIEMKNKHLTINDTEKVKEALSLSGYNIKNSINLIERIYDEK